MKRMIGTLTVCMLLLATASGCVKLTGETLGQNIDDSNITATVKTKLAAERFSTVTRIDVDTVKGVIYLNGVADSAAEKARAEQIASQYGKVVNNLQVRKK
jgi:hyperosmotically inducible periplasmic protein